MARFTTTIRLLDSTESIQRKILEEAKGVINRRLSVALRQLEPRIQRIIGEFVVNQPEYQSLLGGRLQGELGVPESHSRLINIVNTFIQNIRIRPIPLQRKLLTLTGRIIITFDKDIAELTNLSDASYITNKGQVIPWLRWLLLEGDLTIIDYRFDIKPERAIQRYSRTGLGLMFEQPGGRWQVPPEFAGTEENNFLTRAITQAEPRLQNLLQNFIRSALRG